MKIQHWIRMMILLASVAVLVAAATAQQQQNQAQPNQNQNQAQPNQNQNQAQPNQNQTQPNQNTNQPKQKKNFWQKVQEAAQKGQNTMQQGSNTVQQGTGTVQQNGQQVQNGMQQVQNGAQQGTQQGMQPMQQGGGIPSDQGNGAFSGGGGGAGACGPSCFDAGPFQANVSQMTMSQQGGWHVIRMNIQFHNATNQPLIIAYHDGSMVMVDNNGNTYIPAGGNPGELQGMGIDRGNQTDSQFVLGPGQTGNALFSVARGRPDTSPVGTGYTYNLTLDELQAQNGAMAIPVRTYNLNFPSLAPGTSNAAFGSNAVATGKAGAVGNATGAAAAVPQRSNQVVRGQQNVGATPQQRVVNGRPVGTPVQTTAAPVARNQTTAAPVMKNAAMKSPVAPAKPSAAPVVRQATAVPAPAAAKPATASKKPANATAATTTAK
ncbi:MAG: hypothetical protein ACJ713_12460 [Candidatus Sulfotelmatobacter sp.]